MMTKWEDTYDFIASHKDGVTWWEGCDYFSISRVGWYKRVGILRDVLKEHPEIGRALPRPARGDDGEFRYRVNDLFIDPTGPAIRDGHVDDNKQVVAMLQRLDWENDIAYDKAVATYGGRSSLAKKLKARGGHIAAVIESMAGDLTAISAMK